MTIAVKTCFIASYFLSALFLPWWFSVFLAVVLIAVFEAYFSALIGALLMDVVFGVPIVALGGISYIYGMITAFLVMITVLAKNSLLE